MMNEAWRGRSRRRRARVGVPCGYDTAVCCRHHTMCVCTRASRAPQGAGTPPACPRSPEVQQMRAWVGVFCGTCLFMAGYYTSPGPVTAPPVVMVAHHHAGVESTQVPTTAPSEATEVPTPEPTAMPEPTPAPTPAPEVEKVESKADAPAPPAAAPATTRACTYKEFIDGDMEMIRRAKTAADVAGGAVLLSDGEVGRGHRMRWVPRSKECALPVYNQSDTARCYGRKNVLVFGDSLTRAAFHEILEHSKYLQYEREKNREDRPNAHRQSHQCTYYPKYDYIEQHAGVHVPASERLGGRLRWVRSVTVNDHDDNKLWGDRPEVEHYKEDIMQADIVVMNNGMWDIGDRFCGIKAWYASLKRYFTFIKQHLKPGAKFIVWPLHWLSLSSDRHPKFLKCNSGEKATAFRAATRMAASCLNIPTLDTVPLTKPRPHFTEDGLHYNHTFTHVENDIFMNLFCGDHPPQLRPVDACPAGYEDKMIDKWDEIEAVQRGCNTQRDRGGARCAKGRAAATGVGVADNEGGLRIGTKLCTNIADIHNGTFEIAKSQRPFWRPPVCTLPKFYAADAVDCIPRSKLLLIGTEQVLPVMNDILRTYPGIDTTRITRRLTTSQITFRPAERGGLDDAGGFWHFSLVPSLSGASKDGVPFAKRLDDIVEKETNATLRGRVEEADVVVVETGFSDMGWMFCGVRPFYEAAKKTLTELKAAVKGGARVIAMPMPWLHFDDGEMNWSDAKNYKGCHNPKKARVFREAYTQAAACAGVEVLDLAPMYKTLREYTKDRRDGSMYDYEALFPILDIIGNVVCGDLALPQGGDCSKETESAAMARWLAEPAAKIGCSHAQKSHSMSKICQG